MNIRICITGSEIVNGFIHDTNSHFFAKALYALGYQVTGIEVVGDNPEQIKNTWKRLSQTGDLILQSGGLGPTLDDLTVDLICEFLQCESKENASSLKKLEDFFASKKNKETAKETANAPSLDVARRQIRYPAKSEVIENPLGMAPGFFVPSIPFIALPGFPVEIKGMWNDVVKILETLPLQKNHTKQVTLWGMGESDLFSRIKFPPSLEVGVHSKPMGNKLFFRTPAKDNSKNVTENLLQELEQEFPYSIGQDPLKELIEFLKKEHLTITMAESCTAGLSAKILTDFAGASAVFHGSVVSYANNIKEKVLGVRPETIDKHGAVSKQSALEMAEGVRKLMHADVAFSVTGIAGPSGGSIEKPVGTVFLGFSFSNELRKKISLPSTLYGQFYYPFGRERFRTITVQTAYIVLWQIFCKAKNFSAWQKTELAKNFKAENTSDENANDSRSK